MLDGTTVLLLFVLGGGVLLATTSVHPGARPAFLAPWHVVVSISTSALVAWQLALLGLGITILSARPEPLPLQILAISMIALFGITLFTLVYLLCRRSGHVSSDEGCSSVDEMQEVAREIEDLLRGTRRFRDCSVEVCPSSGSGPAIGLHVSSRRRLRLMVGRALDDVMRKPPLRGKKNKPARVACMKAIAYHEVGHFLDGDHRVCSVLHAVGGAYLLYLALLALGLPGLLSAVLVWAPSEIGRVALLLSFLFVSPAAVFFLHRWAVRKAAQYQESRADLRAIRSLNRSERDLLFDKEGRRGLWAKVVRALELRRSAVAHGLELGGSAGAASKRGSASHVPRRILVSLAKLANWIRGPWVDVGRVAAVEKEVAAMRRGEVGPLSAPHERRDVRQSADVDSSDADGNARRNGRKARLRTWAAAFPRVIGQALQRLVPHELRQLMGMACLLGVTSFMLWVGSVAISALATPPAYRDAVLTVSRWLFGIAVVLCPAILFMGMVGASRVRIKSDVAQGIRVLIALSLSAAVGSALAVSSVLAGTALMIHITGGTPAFSAASVANLAFLQVVWICAGCFVGWLTSREGAGDDTIKKYAPSSPTTIAALCIAVFVAGPGAGMATWYPTGLAASLLEAYGAGLMFGVMPFLFLSAVPSRMRWVIPFGFIPTAEPAMGCRCLWRNMYTDTVDGGPARVLVRCTALFSTCILGCLALSTAALAVITPLARDSDAAVAQVLGWIILGGAACVLYPLLTKPREVHAYDPPTLELILGWLDALRRRFGSFSSFPKADRRRVKGLVSLLAEPGALDRILVSADTPEWIHTAALTARLARTVDKNELVESWKPVLAKALGGWMMRDGTVRAWPGGPAVLRWTAWAAELAIECQLPSPRSPAELLEGLGTMLQNWERPSQASGVRAAAYRRREFADAILVLERHKRPAFLPILAAAALRGSSAGNQNEGIWWSEMAALGKLSGDSEIVRAVTRKARTHVWATIHQNPDKQLGRLLDCYRTVLIYGAGIQELPATVDQVIGQAMDNLLVKDVQIQTGQ